MKLINKLFWPFMIKTAFFILSKAIQSDKGYAISWQANLACMAMDAGAPHNEANERAKDFMRRLFGEIPNDNEKERE